MTKPKVPKTPSGTRFKLGILERISIRRLFPQESNLVKQVLARDIDNKINFQQAELKTLGIKQEDGQVTWQSNKDKGKFIDFTDAELQFLKEQIDELDKKNKITADMVDVCLKIKDAKKEDKN
jgi:hypothetical protein